MIIKETIDETIKQMKHEQKIYVEALSKAAFEQVTGIHIGYLGSVQVVDPALIKKIVSELDPKVIENFHDKMYASAKKSIEKSLTKTQVDHIATRVVEWVIQDMRQLIAEELTEEFHEIRGEIKDAARTYLAENYSDLLTAAKIAEAKNNLKNA